MSTQAECHSGGLTQKDEREAASSAQSFLPAELSGQLHVFVIDPNKQVIVVEAEKHNEASEEGIILQFLSKMMVLC